MNDDSIEAVVPDPAGVYQEHKELSCHFKK